MIAPWRDPAFAEPLAALRAHPWLVLGEALVLLLLLVALLGLTIVGWGLTA